jgi:hypothetical protein
MGKKQAAKQQSEAKLVFFAFLARKSTITQASLKRKSLEIAIKFKKKTFSKIRHLF